MSLAKVGSYAFYSHPNLEKVKISATSIEANAFQNSKKLHTVELTSEAADTIAADSFNGCSALEHVIVRSSATSTLSNTSAFTGTKIIRGEGGIYVPADLLDAYKAKTNWVSFKSNIFPIGEYPKSEYSTISDSWETIMAGTNEYAVGDTKLVELSDGAKLYLQVIGKSLDTKSDGSGTAKYSWLCKSIYATHRMNATATTSGGWAESEMRTWLRSDVLPLLPSVIREHIVEVNKTYRSKSPNDETLTVADTIWIPSYKEVGFTDATYIESDGVTYPGVFPSGTATAANNARIKYNAAGSASPWWLRSAGSTSDFRCVLSNGSEYGSGADHASGVVFGFCTD